MKKALFCMLVAFYFMAACDQPDKEANRTNTIVAVTDSASDQQRLHVPPQPQSTANFTYEIIDAPEQTFGYRILMDGKLFINQPHVPGMVGVKGFRTKEDAAKVAELVIQKMKNNVSPPTVSLEELQEMKVL